LSELPDCIFKYWVHSREEDTNDALVYRPSDFNFPPSRGREGFEVKKNGQFVQYAIGRDDRSKPIIGHFNVYEPNRLDISFEYVRQPPYTFKILKCDDDVLIIEKRSV
jgi:hypothetical protein